MVLVSTSFPQGRGYQTASSNHESPNLSGTAEIKAILSVINMSDE